MKKELLLKSLLVGTSAGLLCSNALAGSYSNNFNSDPAADPNFAIRAPARWVATGGSDGSGYISLTDAVNDRNGTIVIPDFDAGVAVIGFNFKARVRIGGGTTRPADGLSVSFCDASDPVVGGGLVNEEGTGTGLVVSLDTYDNGNGDGPALDIKVNNVIVAHKRFAGIGSPGPLCCPVETDAAGNPITLETDAAGTPAPGIWVDLEISLAPSGAVSVKYKGIPIYQDVATGFSSRAGRFVVSGRTGGANDNHWIDDLQITTTTSGDLHPHVSSSLPAGNPARDATGTQVQFVIDSLLSFFDPVSPQLLVDGVDVTSDPATTIVPDEGLRTITVTYTPSPAWAPNSRHEAVLNYSDTDSPPVAATVRKTILVSPVVPATAAGTTLFIEAEDFNYSDGTTHGQYFDFGSPVGSYNTKAAQHDVDYHQAASNADSPLYRVLNPPNGISIPGVPDNLRAGVPIEVTMDYKVGWNDPGDWFNFTRTFPNTTYKIYGRFASGGSATAAELSKVTSDPTVGGQTTVSLGTFRGEATAGWDTFCFIPLRDPSGQDVIVRLSGINTLRVTTLPGNYDFNYLAFVPTLAPTLRPALASATPTPDTESPVRDSLLIKAVIVDRDTQVVADSIRLFLDGVELTPAIRTDTAAGAEAQSQLATSLAPGSTHTAMVIFTDNDAVPVTQTNSWSFSVGIFKSGSGTLFIEAEDFNYSNADGTGAGQHANFGDPDCSLMGKSAVLGVDYNEVNTGNDQAIYRGLTSVEAGKQGTDGFVRGDHTISCSYIVGWNDAGDWYNYTRDFGPSARYNVYARLSSGGAPENAELSLVTSDPTQPGQTTSRLGGFSAPATGNWDIFHNVPLMDASGNLASVRLGGVQTLRFTTLPGNFDFNYLALVKADVQVVTPTIASVSPAQNSDYARAAKVTAVIKDEDSLVAASSLTLTFDGSDVTASSTITDTPSGAMIVYQAPTGSPAGTVHTVTVTWRDDQATPASGSFTWTYREGPYNPDLNLFIEAEDFNTGSGSYLPSTAGHPFGEKGLYNTLGATPEVDYHDSGDGQESNLYRTEGVANIPHVNMVVPGGGDNIGGVPRPGFETVPDYKIGWTDSAGGGDWYNYTRNFGDGAYYNVYLRASHGDAAATIGGRLELVDDPTSTAQTTTPLGNFRAPATGGWDAFTFVPLKAPDGSLVEVPLSGVTTLRYTVEASGGDINFLMLNPVRPLNECPTAGPVNVVSVDQDSQVNFQLQGSDPEGSALEYSVVQGPTHGNLVVQAQTGAANYTPTAGYYGPDSFTYRVSDGRCASAPVTVAINVRLVNRAPTARIIATPLVDFSPEVVNKLVISYNGSNACLLLDGSTSSDPESPLSALTFSWFIVPSPIPFAEGVLATGCLDIGSHLIQLSVRDPQGAEGLDTLAVDVVTASEAIEELIALVNDSTVARSTKRPFIASLKSAAAASDRGQCNTAQNVLHAFQNKVRAQVEPSDPATAADWIRRAQAIIDALDGCVTPVEP